MNAPTTNLIDGNNWVRVIFEKTSDALRQLATEAYFCAEPTIWIWDGKNSRQKRREIYPGYKDGRKPADDSFWQTVNLLKDCLRHTAVPQLSVDGYEADDVIATLIKASPDKYFKITSTDKDFAALEGPKVKLIRPGFEGVPADKVRLFKSLVGDKSDNIPGVPGLGEATFAKLDQESWIKAMGTGVLTIECQIGLSDKLWAKAQASWPLLQTYWKVIDFLEVPAAEIGAGLSVGKKDFAEMNKLLAAFFL